MNISVILCTYNRCESLAKALDSLAASVMPESLTWEVLVVDNNSNDRTRDVVGAFSSRYGKRFRYLLEPQPGLSNARNAGIREARGHILAFVDDDVTVEPTWLQNLTSALHDSQWAGSGGRVLPARGFVPPHWLALEGPCNLVGVLCAYCERGDVPGELEEPPIGANMAFGKNMFEKYGKFRTDLGRRPDSLMGHEDTEFGRRLMAGGERLRYEPSAVVYHEINVHRVRKEFFLAWWFGFGRSSVRETQKPLGTWKTVKILGRAVLTIPLWLLQFDPQRRFYSKCRIWLAAGKLFESYQQAKAANASRARGEAEGGQAG